MIQKAKEGGDSLMIVNFYRLISKSSNLLSVFFTKDGFYCANQLKENFKEDFEILTSLDVEFEENKTNMYKISNKNKVIELDPINGEMTQIR